METGGLSGKPLTELSTSTVRDMYKLTNGKSFDIHYAKQLPLVNVFIFLCVMMNLIWVSSLLAGLAYLSYLQ